MMDKDQMDDTRLDALFDRARAQAPEVPDALMARVMVDAVEVQPAVPLRTRMSRALGGLPGLGGLVTATCVGIWLGVAPPNGVPDLAGDMLGFEAAFEDSDDPVGLSGFGWDIGEG